jgi:hypothetical protein
LPLLACPANVGDYFIPQEYRKLELECEQLRHDMKGSSALPPRVSLERMIVRQARPRDGTGKRMAP